MIKTTARVDGMSCGTCENDFNEAVRKAFAVKKVTSSRKKRLTEILAETWYGRLFIRLYYAVSPPAVKLFVFQDFFRARLDTLVSELQTDGAESAPYDDKAWQRQRASKKRGLPVSRRPACYHVVITPFKLFWNGRKCAITLPRPSNTAT